MWDVPDEGNFTDVNTGKEVTFTNWRLNFPDGGTLENCVVQQVRMMKKYRFVNFFRVFFY